MSQPTLSPQEIGRLILDHVDAINGADADLVTVSLHQLQNLGRMLAHGRITVR